MLRYRWYVLFMIFVLAFSFPSLAQESESDTCELDLTNVSALLSQAEEALSSDDTQSAVVTLTEVRDLLNEMLSLCTKTEVSFEAATYEGGDGYFTMDYPVDWGVNTGYSNKAQGTVAYFATSPEAMQALVTPTPVLDAGEQAVTFILQDSRFMGVQADTPDGEALAQSLNAMISQIPLETDSDEVTEITVGEINGVSQALHSDTFEGALMIFLLDGNNIAIFYALGAPGEGDILASTIEQMVSTFAVGE